MAPLTDAILFLVVGLLFIPISRRFSKANSIKVLVFLMVFLGAFSTVLYLPIQMIAMLILSIGLAVAGANLAQRFASTFILAVRRTILVLLVIVVLSGVGLYVSTSLKERQALSDLPAANPGAPNVLLIVMDTVRAENLSLYGYDRATTPVLQNLSQQGIVFQEAISTAPWTLPSHASIFTGYWHHELSADWETPLDSTYPTLAEVLQAQGYETAGFVGNNIYVSYEHGLNRGFVHFEDYDTSAGQTFVSSSLGRALGCWRQLGPGCILRKLTGYFEILGRKSAQEVNQETLNWISGHQQKPYFIFINYFDAHAPYLPPKPYDRLFGPARPPFSKVFIEGLGAWDGTPAETQREEYEYDGAINYVDHEIGMLLDQMRAQGLLDNTLIIITSDHGEEFHEHNVMSHGNSLYRQSVQVPLMMIYPGHLPSGATVSDPISLRNIPSTVMDLLGLQAASPFPGSSLTAYLDNAGNASAGNDEILLSEVTHISSRPSYYPISKGDMKSIEFDGLRYIQNSDGTEELYDFNTDPEEKNNLVNTLEGQAALPQFRSLLESILSTSNAK